MSRRTRQDSQSEPAVGSGAGADFPTAEAEGEPAPDRGDAEEIRLAARALQDGAEPAAFEPIYRRFYRPLYLFFANRPALRDEAEDLAHQTLLRAYERIGQYRFDARFAKWLQPIAERVWKNAVRQAKAAKRGPALESLDAQADEGPQPQPERSVFQDAAPTPEEKCLAAERTRVLQQAMEGLPPGMRLCTELRVLKDLSYEEIAQVAGIGLNSVRSQLFEARKRLKPVLQEYFGNEDL